MPKFPDYLSTCQRRKLAKERAAKLVSHISTLFLMHEANAIVIHSPKLAEQIPPSYAAHAFNQFRHSMHLFELVRLCALWDNTGSDRESIPTIVELFNKPEIIDQLVQSTRDFFLNQAPPANFSPNTDPAIQEVERAWWENYRPKRAEHEARKTREWLSTAINNADNVRQAPQLCALRKFRDAYIAHNLDLPEPPSNEPTSVYHLKHADVAKLLTETVAIADALHLGLNGCSFDWEDTREIARTNARALWEVCQFHVKR